jgi:predicted amidohydrolase YtcJ
VDEGSDWPVSPSVNPWIAIETLVTRQRPGGGGEPPLAKKEAITLKEAIDIFTRNGARQFGHADKVGEIKSGMLADLVVLDRNPFNVPITDVHDIKVKQTLVQGELVHSGSDK